MGPKRRDRPTPHATLQEVAQRAHVSVATVSRCLNAPDLVRPATRERVEKAVAETGYTPHFGGRALALGRTNMVGVVIPTMENAIFAQGLQAMQETLADAGVTMLVATAHYDDTKEAEQVRTLLSRGVDALALIGDARPLSTYRLIASRGVPFVTMWIHANRSGHPTVGFDNVAAARSMAEHVLAHGHRRIAMIAGLTANNDRARSRVSGVRAALAAAGLALKPPLLVEAAYDLEQSARLAGELLTTADPPSAIIGGNDVIAAGALMGARRHGLSVPGDVSIVGFDDIDLAKVVEPALTTVRVPHKRMGRAAAGLLLALMEGKAPQDTITIKTAIIERASLARPGERARQAVHRTPTRKAARD